MNGPIDTTGYLILGMSVIFTIFSAFVGSIYLRFRSLARTLRQIEQYERR